MFRIRKEGEIWGQGINLQLKPWFQVVIFIGLYHNRFMLGLAFPKGILSPYPRFQRWTRYDDFKSWSIERGQVER